MTAKYYGVDYSAGADHWSSAKIASFVEALHASGRVFAVRYLGSWDSGKGLTKVEFDQLVAHGIKVCFFYEQGTTSELGGADVAALHAADVKTHLAALGVDPLKQPVIYATDTDAHESQVDAYYTKLVELMGLQNVWAYGGYTLVKGLFDKGVISGACQALAWSTVDPVTGAEFYGEGRVLAFDDRAQLRQHGDDQTTVEIDGTEGNAEAAYFDDFGQYPRPSVVIPTKIETAETIFTSIAHSHHGRPYGWGHEGRFPIGNPPEGDADCSGEYFDDFAETDQAVLAINGVGIPWADGTRWYTSPTQHHRMTANGYYSVAHPLIWPFEPRIGDAFFHVPTTGHAVHIGFLCHKGPDGTWWTTEERNGCEHHKLADLLHRYPAGELKFGRLWWVNMQIELHVPAPTPTIDVSKRPFLMYPAKKTVLVDGKTKCADVKIVQIKGVKYLKDVKDGGPIHHLQSTLTKHGFDTKGVDGVYGHDSATAVSEAQKAKKLHVDGEAGINTWTMIEGL